MALTCISRDVFAQNVNKILSGWAIVTFAERFNSMLEKKCTKNPGIISWQSTNIWKFNSLIVEHVRIMFYPISAIDMLYFFFCYSASFLFTHIFFHSLVQFTKHYMFSTHVVYSIKPNKSLDCAIIYRHYLRFKYLRSFFWSFPVLFLVVCFNWSCKFYKSSSFPPWLLLPCCC